MSYEITVRVYQTNRNAYFWACEKTVWHKANGGTWSTEKDKHLLHMNGTNTSGIIRFESDSNPQEHFVLAIGIHNQKPWGSIVTGLQPGQTGVMLHSQFYNGGPHSRAPLNDVGSYSTVGTSASQLQYQLPPQREYQLHIRHNGNSHYTADLIIG